jgi:hypothetical protein
MSNFPALPAISSPLAPDVRQWIEAATAIIATLAAQNPRADGMDAAVTFRDLTTTTGMKVTAVQGTQLNQKPRLNISP